MGFTGPTLEQWPFGALVVERAGSAAGDWRIRYANERARERLALEIDEAELALTSVYTIERRLGVRRSLIAKLNDPSQHFTDLAHQGLQVVAWGERRIVIMSAMQELEEAGALAALVMRSIDSQNQTIALCCARDGGSVLILHAADNQLIANADGHFVDELLNPSIVEPVLDLIDRAHLSGTLEHAQVRRRGAGLEVTVCPAPSGIFLVTLKRAPDQVAGDLLSAQLLCAGINQVALGFGQDALITAWTRAAEEFWDRPLEGVHVNALIGAVPDNGAAFWEGAQDMDPTDLAGQHFVALLNDERTRTISLALRGVQIDGQALSVLTIEPVAQLRRSEQTIHDLAHFDTLTRLPNRQLFCDRLQHAIDMAATIDGTLAVLVVDIDKFKLINDSLGFDQGDSAIRAIGERLQQTIEPNDTLARASADEFLLLCHQPANAEEAAKLAKAVQIAMQPPIDAGAHEISVSVSIGIAMFPHDGNDPTTLLRNAYAALGRAKAQGRDSSQFFTEDMNVSALERLMLETRLRKALKNEELTVHYQPQVDAQSGAIAGVEALIRWTHPELGMISPGDFIPLAEETGLILPIGQWVLRTACDQVVEWHHKGHHSMRLAVNLSAIQFELHDLVDEIRGVLESTGLPAESLELELTESVVMRDASTTVGRLTELRKLGVSLAVDDFGTGYSSLAYLKRFPVRSLKIDRSFVGDIDQDANSAAIVQAIIALARTMDMKLVAEGVETAAQRDLLRDQGCEEMQGYFFARPMAADALEQLLQENAAEFDT